MEQIKRMAQLNPPLGRLLKMGLIGGGGAAFIGKVHAVAGKLDHRAEIAAAALSRDLETSRASAAAFGLTPEQAYGGAESLIASMADQLDFVAIATPNYTHAPIALAALNAGLHVICDKPMTTTAKDAQDLIQAVESSNRVFALTHNYTGYPLVRQAKAMVNSGDIGEIIAVRATYTQGWLHAINPDETPARGAWKSDPALAGPSGALGDIGTHAYNLITHVTNLVPQKLSASIRSYAPVRTLDDYGQVNIDFGNDVLGMVNFSQVSHGRLNDLWIEVDGTTGSLIWRQECPNQLEVRRQGESMIQLERHPAGSDLHASARSASRIPPGHPEGFYEAFANIYRAAYDDMLHVAKGESIDHRQTVYPNVYDGADGVRFIDRCLESNRQQSQWIEW